MTDNEIIDLYFARDERALVHTATRYGGYCTVIAKNLLSSAEDSDECVNDTWLHAWQAIPPARPLQFKTYLGRLCRNLAIDRLRGQNAQKRAALTVLLDELSECLPGGDTPEEAFDAAQTGRRISEFLRDCDKNSRVLFVRRYFYGDSLEAAASRCGMTQSAAKSSLYRTRNKLKEALEKEGVTV